MMAELMAINEANGVKLIIQCAQFNSGFVDVWFDWNWIEDIHSISSNSNQIQKLNGALNSATN